MKNSIPKTMLFSVAALAVAVVTFNIFANRDAGPTPSVVSYTSKLQPATESALDDQPVQTTPPVERLDAAPTPAVPPESTDVVIKPEDQQWLKHRPFFESYCQQQNELVRQAVKSLNSDLVEMSRNVDTETFTDELMSLDAMGQQFTDEASTKRFLANAFSQHVLNFSELDQSICERISELNLALIELDNQLLIDCGLDTEFDPASVGLAQPDLSIVRQAFVDAVPSFDRMLENAFVSNLVTTGAGLVAADIASDLAFGLGHDQYGEPTIASYLFSGVAGFVADEVAGEAASSLMQTRESIQDESRQIVVGLMNKLIWHSDELPQWVDTMADQAGSHRAVCSQLLANEYGMDAQEILDAAGASN